MLGAAAAAGQTPQFGAQSRLVLIPVTVTDSQGNNVDSLNPEDFVVLDNGKRQKVSVDTLTTGVAPIALVVAVQSSGISQSVLEKVQKLGSLFQPLVTGEHGCTALVSFSERVIWLQECTGDEDSLTRAFRSLRRGAPKAGRMRDAVYESIEKLKQYPNSRRVLLLISESRDRGSRKTLEEASIAAQAAGVSVYAATYSAFVTGFTSRSSDTGEPRNPQRSKTPSEETGTLAGSSSQCNPNGCRDPRTPPPEQRVDILSAIGELARMNNEKDTEVLTKVTGGVAFPFTRLRALEKAIESLGAELHSQYVLTYAPGETTDGYHELDVRVPSGNFQVRARPGYWSGNAP